VKNVEWGRVLQILSPRCPLVSALCFVHLLFAYLYFRSSQLCESCYLFAVLFSKASKIVAGEVVRFLWQLAFLVLQGSKE